MAEKIKALKLPSIEKGTPKAPVIGVYASGDPRIDKESLERAKNIVGIVSDELAGKIIMPDGVAVDIVYSDVLVDCESNADLVAQQFRDAGVNVIICLPDTWAFPQLTTISLLQQFPKDTPLNITCGNSGPKPGVVYAQATHGALSQYGRMVALNVGSWPDTGLNPKPSKETITSLIDWCYAAVTRVALKGRRVLMFGHDSMGMETALAHILQTRNTFGLEITRLDMKLLADMVNKKAYDKKELEALRAWVDKYVGKKLEIKNDADSKHFNQSLALYLIIRDLMEEINAIGGGFMNQLEWGSDSRGIELPSADLMESLFNSTFDHNGAKAVQPFATEADCQGLLTMLFMTWLSGGNPPLFMDFRKVWEGAEIKALAKKLKIDLPKSAPWLTKGVVDGNNSGSASLDWAAKPGTKPEEIMKKLIMPLADPDYFPGGGNSVSYVSPGGIEGIAARLTYCTLNDKFGLVWDEAVTTKLPDKLEKAMCNLTNWNWPHTFLIPKYASMMEYKQYAPANHLHMTWGLPVARLQHWMDLTAVLNLTPWAARPSFVEGLDRPQPLVHILAGGETAYKSLV